MILKNARLPINGQPVENTFLLIDEHTGREAGSAVIVPEELPVLYPARPMQVRIDLDGEAANDLLLGAAVARAKELCVRSGLLSRIYTRCAPKDDTLMQALEPFGFRDNDGLVRMQLRLPADLDAKAPTGCVVVYDALDDPTEQRYFLERYNRLNGTQYGEAWLRRYIDRKDFMRILVASSKGMAGEVLVWREGYSGIIGYILVAKRWRRLGVGSYLLSLACDEFEQQALYSVECSARARVPNLMKLLEKNGFHQEELLMRYPGMDISPIE